MIALTRIAGLPFVLNCDLIERVDCTPDTVVTLVDGKKYVVSETLQDVVVAVRRHRSEIIALSNRLEAVGLDDPRGDTRGDLGGAQLSPVTPITSKDS